MYESYENIVQQIDDLIYFLKEIGIEAEFKSYLEHDYLKAHEFYENYKKDPQAKKDEEGRAALIGLFELYKWIWSVKDCCEFGKLTEHLKLLAVASPKINSVVSIISPVTGKQDDKSNKFIEAIIGMYAVKVGKNVDLDDPINSSDGKNPDVIFDFFGNRIAIACKTLRGKTERTVIDNLILAAKQIERANCDFGYIVINAMNVLPHEKIKNDIYDNPFDPIQVLSDDLTNLYIVARSKAEDEILKIFQSKKFRPAVLSFIHSVARLNTPLGITSTSLKSTFVTNFEIPGVCIAADKVFLGGVNEFIHNRL